MAEEGSPFGKNKGIGTEKLLAVQGKGLGRSEGPQGARGWKVRMGPPAFPKAAGTSGWEDLVALQRTKETSDVQPPQNKQTKNQTEGLSKKQSGKGTELTPPPPPP